MRLLALSLNRYILRTPWTSTMVLVGAALGVASVVAVHLLSVAVGDTLRSGSMPHLEGVTHVATRRDASMDDYFALRRSWRAGALPGRDQGLFLSLPVRT